MSQTNHPNIVRFLGVCKGNDKYDLTLLMEQLHTDLHIFIIRNPEIADSTKLSILADISSGLLYLHEKCLIVHRDLTAANILLTSDNQAKIADLGVSRIVGRSPSQLTKTPGTLPYMPPEALKDNPTYNENLDVFSFGVLTLYLLIEVFPEYSFDNIPDAIVKKGEGEIHRRNKWLSKIQQKPVDLELRGVVLWCLADNASDRPSTLCLNIILEELKKEYVVTRKFQ